jgi:CO dehydrogenase maturation factor
MGTGPIKTRNTNGENAMGIFHCPVGAAFYDDEDCIDCGMCTAETEEQMVEASKKIRAYLRTNAPKPGPVKKIAVCGKGGVGKSSITTLIAGALKTEGFTILVLDTDESNPGLFRMFGFENGPKPLMTLLSRFASNEPAIGTEWLMKGDTLTVQDIPKEFILENDGLRFLMIGKIEDPFQGCACSMADIARDLMRKLVPNEKEIVLVDMEAGVESFGRGVERNVDTVLIIVEPSFESMALAGKIGYMCEGMGIFRVRAVLNKVPSEKIRQRMIEELDRKNIKVIGTVYYDPELSEAGFEGRPPGQSKAAGEVEAIIKNLFDEAN